MYLDYYALNTKPFKLSPDPSFIWMGERYREALAVLQYGLIDKKGFLLITGDVGTGKTTLINTLLNGDIGDTVIANVPNPDLETLDFLNFIAFALGLGRQYQNKGAFLIAFGQFLNRCYDANKSVVLIIDEAHCLNNAQLEQIRLLSNIERQDAKLINIFFVGQNEFLDHITETRNRALRQRLTINYHLDPLSHGEVSDYIQHRLKIAGAKRPIFSENAVESLYYHSRGYPRVINNIADLALLTGYVKSSTMIDAQIVAECAEDLLITPQPTIEVVNPSLMVEDIGHADLNQTDTAQSRNSRIGKKLALATVVCLALAALYVPTPIKNWLAKIAPPTGSVSQGQSPPRSRVEAPSNTPNQELDTQIGSAPEANLLASAEIRNHGRLENQTIRGTETPAENAPLTASGSQSQSPPRSRVEAPSNTPNQELDTQIGPAPEATKATHAAVQVNPRGNRSESEIGSRLPEKVMIPFDYNSAALTATQHYALETFLGYLGHHPRAKIIVKGYTDARGNPKFNARLSQLRADRVKKFLVARGIEPSRIATYALGPADPIASNDSAEGRQQNRRVELSLFPNPSSDVTVKDQDITPF